MKLTTEKPETLAPARVHDYQSGAELGTVEADWRSYRAWAEGPSEVCEAHRCLSAEAIEKLNIAEDHAIFLIEASTWDELYS